MNRQRFFRRIALVLSVGSFGYFLILGKGGLKDCYRLRCENATLMHKIEQLEIKKDRLNQKITAYRQGDFSREKLAREELLMGHGEFVYLS